MKEFTIKVEPIRNGKFLFTKYHRCVLCKDGKAPPATHFVTLRSKAVSETFASCDDCIEETMHYFLARMKE